MRIWQTIRHTDTARSRNHLFSLSSVSLLLAVAGGGSVAWALQNSEGSRAVSNTHSSAAKVGIDAQQSTQSPDAALHLEQFSRSGFSDTSTNETTNSPDVINANLSSTTITVNGQTTHVTGNGSYDKSYLSDDGTTHVDISVHSSSVRNGNEIKEDAMD